MKTDQLILLGAVGFAAFLVAQKTGVFKKAGLISGAWPSLTFQNDTPFTESQEEKGYDPANPGNYVFLEDLIKGVADDDWGYTPSKFEQNVDELFYKPTYPW